MLKSSGRPFTPQTRCVTRLPVLIADAHHMRGTSSNIRHAIRSRASPKALRRYSSASRTNTVGREDSDVVIVGGGPAGLALASALGAHISISPVARSSLCVISLG